MAFTYTATLATTRHQVRFLIQDTTNTTARPNLLDDGEIDWVLTVEKNVYMAAAACADVLASRFRGLVSKSVGGLHLEYDRAASTWKEIAARLRQRGSLHQLITAGGVLKADRDDIWEDDTLLAPAFFSTLHQDATLPATRRPDLTAEELP